MEHTSSQYHQYHLRPIHPHTCGAYVAIDSYVFCPGRFIPTPVGHTPAAITFSRFAGRFIPTPVGHTTCICLISPVSCGSSPHLWGIRCFFFSCCIVVAVHPHTCGAYGHLCRMPCGHFRFIPTPVGHTTCEFFGISRETVHPHTCGAYPIVNCLPIGTAAVHPHTCGAYCAKASTSAFASGSSPHLWGILKHTLWIVLWTTVHPHTCGAYNAMRFQAFKPFGSSPHLWGILNRAILRIDIYAVHPHTCGAYVSKTSKMPAGHRFIPTPVGHT